MVARCPHQHPDLPRPQDVGVLLVNLGTPDDYTYWPMRRYLREFLSDVRVVDLNRWLWYPILYLFILTFRPSKAGAAYKKIWNTEKNESPLRTITRNQAEKLQKKLGKNAKVAWGMRYGNPSIESQLKELEGCRRVIVVPLYPQYAGATYGTVQDAVGLAVQKLKFTPAIQTIQPYYDDPEYIKALADSIRKQYKNKKTPDTFITSFHGVPVRYCTEGDPYFCHCHKTARLLAEELGWTFVPDWRKDLPEATSEKPRLILTFQSIFGKEVWLQPYTDESLEALASEKGVTHIGIAMPGFASDCVETLEEINIEGREEFLENGGKKFDCIPCLNDSAAHISLISNQIKKLL